ncbi:MAG TPA: PKD domain-containing protein [Candidatus Thermoplasmatota archaeon]|nr:PKD domain-containing protein [Candidatus Thermoplasmatota archaeon]
MEKIVGKKCFTIGIMFLFIGASVLPVISGATQNSPFIKGVGKQGNPHHPKIQNNQQNHPQKSNKGTTNVKQENRPTLKENTKKTRQTPIKPEHVTHRPSLSSETESTIVDSIASTSGSTQNSEGTKLNNAVNLKTSQNSNPLSDNNENSRSDPQPLPNHEVTVMNDSKTFSSIQAAINDPETIDGYWLYIQPGTYNESVIVNKSLYFLGSGVATPVIDAMGGIGFNISASSVTVKRLNFTNATTAIYCNASGLTVMNNTFWYDINGVVWIIDKHNLASSQTILASTVKYNTFYSNYSPESLQPGGYNDMIYVDLELYYLFNSGYTVNIGDITINQNMFYLNETANADAIYFDYFTVQDLYGGTISMGRINVSGNTIYGGYDGLDFYGEILQIKNVQVTVGDFIVTHNLMVNQTSGGYEDGYGINIDYYDGESWSGTTHAVFGILQITDNTIQSSQSHVYGIEVDDYGYWYNYSNTASLHVGDMIIQDNLVNVSDVGVDFEMYYIGGGDDPLQDHASITLGNFLISGNTINSLSGNEDAMYIDVEHCGYYMYDYASLTIGSFMVVNNTITGYCYDGIDVDNFYEVGYYMYDHSSVIMGSVELTGNDINVTNTDGAGIAFDYLGDIGEEMHNYSSCTIGSIKANNNNITTNGSGDHDGFYAKIEDLGYDMYDNSVFTMGDIQFNQNVIYVDGRSGYGAGMYFDYWEYFGYDLYDNSHCTIGSIEILDNTMIAGNSYGVYLEYYDFGYDMYNHSQFTMGHFAANDNNITANAAEYGNGFYIEWSGMGYYMGENVNDHCVFTMGDITWNNNKIVNSGGEGIYVEDLDDFGEEMHGSSTYTMGNIQFNHNNINTSDYSGMYLYDPERFGEDMYDNSHYTMGNLEANDNTIYAGGGNGIFLYYDEFGYYVGDSVNDHCVFTMGDITVNNNTIHNYGAEAIYADDFYGIGYEMYGYSTVTIGNITFNHNTIVTDDNGITIPYMGEFGYEMGDHSVFEMGNIQFNENHVQCGGIGVFIGGNLGEGWGKIGDIGSYMYGNSSFTMGNIEFKTNNITSYDDDGMYIDIWNVGYEMYDDATGTMGNVQINDNVIDSYDTGIYIDYIGDFGEDMYNNSSFTMGDVETSDNIISAEDGDGIYIYYADFGYRMGYYEELGVAVVLPTCVFTMGNINCNDNTINNAGAEGIYVAALEYIGSQIDGLCTATMGNITFSHNTIFTDGSHGIALSSDADDEGLEYLGYELLDQAQFTMGNIQINDNMINCTFPGYGIYIWWLGDNGESLDNNAQVTIGCVEINNNTLNDGWGDGIDFKIGDFGWNLNNNATVTIRHITMNQNNVISRDDGITDEWSGDFGAEVYDNARYYGGELIVAYNTIDTNNDGIRILGETYDLIVGANTILNAGQGIHAKDDSYNLTFAYNTISGTENDSVLFNSIYNSTLIGNVINASQNKNGIELDSATYNITIVRNTISNNSDTGINVTTSYHDFIYHNNILTNTLQAYDDTEGTNRWNDSYPSGGNYWSDYVGHDNFSGPGQDVAGSDGIGDTPYNITHPMLISEDHYPFTHEITINHKSIYTPSSPFPSNGASGVSIHTNTRWNGGDPDNDYDCYDIYFGTTNPPTYYDTIYFTQGSPISYLPGTLKKDTTYYWKIVAWDAFNDSASGPVWSFNTGSVYSPPSTPWPPADNSIPVSIPGGPYSGIVNKPVQFDGSKSYDNDTWIIQYDWQFFSGDSWHFVGAKPTYTYTTAGTYTVTLRVHDVGGHTADATTTATISPASVNQAPSKPIITGPSTGTPGTPYTYSFVSTDPEQDNIRYFIDWGDGTTSTSPLLANGVSHSDTHTWATSGVYTIRCYAEDQYNATSGTATLSVVIEFNVQRLDNGSYLVDSNGDGIMDHLYNPTTGVLSAYSPEQGIVPVPGGNTGLLVVGILLIVVIIIIILFLLLWRRRRKKEDEEIRKKINNKP